MLRTGLQELLLTSSVIFMTVYAQTTGWNFMKNKATAAAVISRLRISNNVELKEI